MNLYVDDMLVICFLKCLGEGLGSMKLEELLVEETWLEALPGEFQKPYAKKLSEFVKAEIQSPIPIYPPQHLIFNALNSTPFDKVKAVIIGQVLTEIPFVVAY